MVRTGVQLHFRLKISDEEEGVYPRRYTGEGSKYKVSQS